jgi:hypothetical protein
MKQTSFLVLLVMFGYSQIKALYFGEAAFAQQQIAQEERNRQEQQETLRMAALQARKAEQKGQQQHKNRALSQKNQQKAFVQKPRSKYTKQVRRDTKSNRNRDRGSDRTSKTRGYGPKNK